jgi:hypothetical protein
MLIPFVLKSPSIFESGRQVPPCGHEKNLPDEYKKGPFLSPMWKRNFHEATAPFWMETGRGTSLI